MIENRIKDYRSDRGMTQTELAKLVGVRRETIYNLENGKYNPSLSLAWKIAEVFEASIEDVLWPLSSLPDTSPTISSMDI